eukprot:4918201-Pleurochrysis_carterae.AAC.1
MSGVGVGERTIIKVVAKINQFDFEREFARQFSEKERRLKYLSMITYPAHLATKAQEELQCPSYKVGCSPSFPLAVKAFDELWRHAFRNGMIRQQAPTQLSCGGHRADAMHGDAGGGDNDNGNAKNIDMAYDDATLFALYKASDLPTSLKGEVLCYNCLNWGNVAKDERQACFPVCWCQGTPFS